MNYIGDLYAEGRGRMSEMAAGLSADQVRKRVPACPNWTVHDVVAHLAGSCADVLAGKVDGVTTAAWADAQVRERRDRTMAELLEEWSVAAPRLEAVADRFPAPLGRLWILDLTAHEHDLRGAVDRAGARDAPGLLRATEFLVKEGLHRQLVAMARGGLVVQTPDRSWFVGDGTLPPESLVAVGGTADDGSHTTRDRAKQAPAVACSTFELFRALTGRRSPSQIARFDWSTDPAPFVPAFEFGTFTTRNSDLDE